MKTATILTTHLAENDYQLNVSVGSRYSDCFDKKKFQLLITELYIPTDDSRMR